VSADEEDNEDDEESADEEDVDEINHETLPKQVVHTHSPDRRAHRSPVLCGNMSDTSLSTTCPIIE